MYCPKCGAQIIENAKFCQKCGNPVNVQAPATIPTPVNVQAPANMQAPANIPAAHATTPAKPLKYNAFTFISAGITAVMIILFFLPSIVVNGKSFSMFTSITNVLQMDIVPFFFCAILMFAAEALLIVALIFIMKKNSKAIAFVISASGVTAFTLFFFWLTDYAISFATTTAVPVIMLIMAACNVIFYLISRKVNR